MSEFNTEDLDEVIASTNGSLVQMLALQLKNELAKNTALTSQLENVVAENAALKNVDAWMKAGQVGGEAADNAIDDGATPDEATRAGVQAVIDSIKTPATDAFLAEVRASGVELMREHPAIKLCSLTHVCDEFAAQLHQGGAV